MRYYAVTEPIQPDFAYACGRIRGQFVAKAGGVEIVQEPRMGSKKEHNRPGLLVAGRRLGERRAQEVPRGVAAEMAVGVRQDCLVSSQVLTSMRGMWNGPLKMLPLAGWATVPSRCR